MSVPSESFCGVGRPCPNFQRLIKYVEPVEKEKGAAGDGRLRKILRSPFHQTRSSNAITSWNPQTRRLNIGRSKLMSQSNCSLTRRPKFMDIHPTSTKMTSKLETPAGVPAKHKAQQRKWEPRQFQAKPEAKTNETTKKPENQAGVLVKTTAQQGKWEPKLAAARPGVKISELTKKLESPAKDHSPVKNIAQQRKWEPKQIRAKSNVTSSPILDAKLDEELSRMLTQYGAGKLDRRLRQLVELEERKKTPRKQWQ